MPDINQDTIVKLVRLEERHEALERELKALKDDIKEGLQTITHTLDSIEKQTSRWKFVGVGIGLTLMGVWAIFQWVFGDLSHLLHSIRS